MTFLDHLKTIKLQRRHGADAVLCLVRLWFYTAQNRPDGVLTGMDDEDIEIAAKWAGEAGTFVHALLDIGWLIEDQGTYSVNDWDEHQPYVVHAQDRRDKAKKAAAARYARSMPAAECEQAGSIQQACLGSAPSPSPVPFPSPDPEPVTTTSAEPSSARIVVTLPTNTGVEFPIYDKQVFDWAETYPAVDVPQQLREMRSWLNANPRNRKTNSGMLKFVNGWLGRAQNSARAPAKNGGRKTVEDYRRQSQSDMANVIEHPARKLTHD